MAVTLYTSRVVLATLGVNDFGLNTIVTSAITIFYFLNSSMATATSRFLTFELGKNNFEKLKRTFSASLTIHIIIAIVILILGETIGLWYFENKMIIPEGRKLAARWVYQLSLASAMVTITQVPYNASIIAHERMNVYAYIEIAKTCLLLGIVYLLVIGNFDKLILYAILTLCVSIVITLIYRVYCVRHFEECKYQFHFDKKIIFPMITFSGWNLYTDFSYYAQNNGINIILNLFFETAINAAYGLGLQASRAVNNFIANFMTAVRPQITKYYSIGAIKNMESLMLNATLLSFVLFFCIGFPFFLEVNFLLGIWLKQIPAYTNIFCRFFLVMMLLNVLWLNLTCATQATGKMKIASFVIGTLYILIPVISYIVFKFGDRTPYVPMIIAIVIYVIVVGSRLFILKNLIPEISIWRFLNKVILTGLLIIVIASVLPLLLHYSLYEGWFRLLSVSFSSVLVTAIATFYLALNKQMQKKIINKFLSTSKIKYMKSNFKIYFSLLFREIRNIGCKVICNQQFREKYAKGVKLKPLTKEQKKEIKDYYKQMLGVKVTTKWHQLAYSISGICDKRILPFDLYLYYIRPALINNRMRLAYQDKNFFPRILPFVNFPKTILQCSNGFFFSGQQAISREEAVRMCYNLSPSIIKPALNTFGGNNIVLLSVKEGITNMDNKTIEEVFNAYGRNFIIQEAVKQHPQMASLNPTSLNTIRIMSFRKDNEVLICSCFARIGKPGSVVDNMSSGGIGVVVKADGFFSQYAYTRTYSELKETTYTGIVLKDFQIPAFDAVLELVKKAHLAIPQFPLLAWDIAIDENKIPVVVEYNIHFDNTVLIQMGELFFGEYTDEILPIIKKYYDREKNEIVHIC